MLSPIFDHIFLVKCITVSNMYRQSTMNSLSNNCAVFGVSFYLLMGPKFRDLLIGKKVLYHIFLPASPKAEAGLGIAFSVRTSVPARQYLLSVICNSNSFQSILFKLCTVFVYILKMCTFYYGLI